MMLMLICFGPGNQFPYLVIWFPFVFGCRQADVMTMEEQICKSATTSRATTGLLLQSSCPRSVAVTTLSRFASFLSGSINMDITLFPVFVLDLLMKHCMEMDRTLFTATATGISSRWDLFIGTIGMETTA